MKITRQIVVLLAALCAFCSLAIAEEAFPPGARLRENSSWWTSEYKNCDSVWLEFKAALDALELSDEVKMNVRKCLTDGIAERTSEGIKLGAVAAEYWAARRGKVIFKRYNDYGSATKMSDSVILMDALDFYCDISALLANDTVEGIEELIAARGLSAVNLTPIKTRYEPDVLKRYYEITSEFGERVFSTVKVGPDLSEVRKVFIALSNVAIQLAEEFYLAMPSSVDLFVFTDSKGNRWLQFDETPRNPYAGKENSSDGLVTEADCDADVVAALLEGLRSHEKSYKATTLTAMETIMNALPDDFKARLAQYVEKLKK